VSEDKESVSRLAKESDRIRRAREKLLARWGEEEKLINRDALDAIKEKIKNQYHRNTPLRTRFEQEGKSLRLFAQGEGVQTTAGPRVRAVMERVQQEFDQQREIIEKHFPPMTIKPLEVES
jgi:hypothetical protein